MSQNSEERVRYAWTRDPVTTDGRDVDTSIAVLTGEAAQQEIEGDDKRLSQLAPAPWDRVPRISGSDATYYDRPMLKPSVWSVDIPLYYFVGGAAGAALTLGAALQLVAPFEHKELRRLSSVCHWIGIIGSTAGAAFLIHDLGRPSRFLFMLRVFRPTSPMNMGAWILSAAAPTAMATALLVNAPGRLGVIGEICGYLSGVFGAMLATYTGVLVSNTAIPVWQDTGRWMPVLFAASGAATAGSIIDFFPTGKAGRNVGLMFGTAARIAEVAASLRVEKAASSTCKVGEPLHTGRPSWLWKAATVMTVASLTLSVIPGKSRAKRVTAGVLGAAGSLCMRFAVHYATNVSARDPRAAFEQQRAAPSS